MNTSKIAHLLHRVTAVGLVAGILVGLALSSAAPVLADPQTPDTGPFAANLPLIVKDKCTVLRDADLFGFQLYGGTGTSSRYYQDFIDSGATWARVAIKWSDVEPANTTPDKFVWKSVDREVAIAIQNCYPLIVTIGDNPSWASINPEGPLTKVGLGELAQFMRTLVERYDGDNVSDAPGSPKVLSFELYNEPDAGPYGLYERWGKRGADYAAMLKAVYPQIKAANPAAQVIFGGIASDFFTDQDTKVPANNGPFIRTFFDDVMKNGAGPYFDVMNFHFYPLFGGNWTKKFPKDGPGLVEKTEAIRATMTKYGIKKPVIVTETAWHTNGATPYGSDALQVRLLIQLYAQAIVAGVPMVAWWPLGDPMGAYTLMSGLVANDGSESTVRKPAYKAYQVMQREMHGARFISRTASDSADIKAYRFQDDAHNRVIYIAWTNQTDPLTAFGSAKYPYKDTTRSTQISLPASQVSVYDAFWNNISILTDAGDGKHDGAVKVTINGDPKYIVIEGK